MSEIEKIKEKIKAAGGVLFKADTAEKRKDVIFVRKKTISENKLNEIIGDDFKIGLAARSFKPNTLINSSNHELIEKIRWSLAEALADDPDLHDDLLFMTIKLDISGLEKIDDYVVVPRG